MAEHDAAADPAAAACLAMVEALQRSSWHAVLARQAEALDLSQGRPALQARVHAWAAQARLQVGQLDGAGQDLRAALRLAREAGDAQGLQALQPLQQQLFALRTARNAAAPLPDTLLGRALGAMDRSDWEAADTLVAEAIASADADADPREQVLARLARARMPGQAEAAIRDAWRIADASNDKNLVTAVAKAARAAGLELEPHVF